MTSHHLTPTDDGTFTIFSDEYGQAMHTLSGAYDESLLKHVVPSKILDRSDTCLRVLDVGFGIGYNVLALLDRFLKDPKGRRVEISSLEKEMVPVELLRGIVFPGSRGTLYEALKGLLETGQVDGDGFSARLIIGDARRSVRQLPSSSFHAVFHDAFSPSKNPELWTVDFFREIYRAAADGSILTTYSSAPQVRGALLEAGFIVGKGPSVGNKREGTVAAKGDAAGQLNAVEIETIRRDVKSTPYRDPGFSSSREEILARRIGEMKKLRECQKKGNNSGIKKDSK
jgi:tRNA U34 5-methylaminomethyl-2-thiouridine-forming methyltransferase MnmC